MTRPKPNPKPRGSKPGVPRGAYKGDAKAEALALIAKGATAEEAAEDMKRRGKPIGKTVLYEALAKPGATASPNAPAPSPPVDPPAKPPPITAEKPPANLSHRERRLWIVEQRITTVRNALAIAEAEGSTRTAPLEKQLREWLDDHARLQPPEPPDPNEEEKRWKVAADMALAKIRAGVKEARERMAARMGHPFPGDAAPAGGGAPRAS